MKLPVLSATSSLCDQCVALCCRYFAFAIDKPKTRRDFEDLRWFILHEDCIIFVENGDWYIQINRKCKALLPDNRCSIYESRPAICREYTTEGCDWHGDEYDYDELFTEPDQVERYMKEFLAKQRKRKANGKLRKVNGASSASSKKLASSNGQARVAGPKRSTTRARAALRFRKSA